MSWCSLANTADWLIFLAYVAIPIQLVMVLRSVPLPGPIKRLRTGFFAFILTCGVTHLVTAASATPREELIATTKIICSVVSWLTVFMMMIHFSDLVELLRRGYELESRVAYLEDESQQLQTMNHKASDLAKAKTNFIATISHEIRTPLNAVLGASELVLEEENNDQKTQYLKLIQDSGAFLMSLLNDIIDVAQIEKGMFQPTLTEFPVRKMIHSTMAMLSDRAKLKCLTMETIIAQDIPDIIHSDERRIQQVIVNLMSNSFKFTRSKGTVCMHVSVAPVQEVEKMARAPGVYCCQMKLDFHRKRNMLVFKVRDNGCGIDKENLPKIFNRFEQADGTITRKYGGTGLGLYIVREVANAMNGMVFVSSKVGVGSEFTFAIPIFQPTRKSRVAVQQISVEDFKSEMPKTRILVAEDNQTNQVIIRRMLNRIGFTDVIVVENGEEAVAKVHEDPYIDVVLMDMHMPKMDGISATKAIREDFSRAQPYIVLVSAEDVTEWKSFRFDGAILKPCAIDSLKQAFLRYFEKQCDDKCIKFGPASA